MEGERGPLHFVEEESIVEVAAVLHPDFVFLFGGEIFLFRVHYR